MEGSGDRMDIDGPSFNLGRRRTFAEFAEGEDVQVARVHQHLYSQVPISTGRRVNRFAIPEPPAELPALPNDQTPLAWAQLVARTIAVGTVVIAVLSVATCKAVVRGATRAGRQTWERREHIKQTCVAAVESSYNVAKRRLVTLELSIREQYLELEGMGGIDPMEIDSDSSLDSGSSMDFEFEDEELHGQMSDRSAVTGHDANTNVPASSDTADGVLPGYNFAGQRLAKIVTGDFDSVHDVDMEDATDSSLQSVTNLSPQASISSPQNPIPPASNSSFQNSAGSTNFLPPVATPTGATGVQSKSPSLPVTPDLKPAPKKSVAFFVSPKTGRPITETKKFIAGESMDFPVGSSPASDGSSSLSSRSSMRGSARPDDTLIHHEQATETSRSSEQPDIAPRVDLYEDAEPAVELPHRSQASASTGDDNVGPSNVETAITVSARESINEAETPAEVVEVTAVDTAVEGNRRAARSSRERSQSPREGLRRSTRNREITKLARSFESIDLSTRRESLRVLEKAAKDQKALEEQRVAEAAEKRREEKEAEEAARKSKEAEAAQAREEHSKQNTRRTPKEKVIQPLDATWEANVQQALNTPNMREVLVTLSSGVSLTRKDIGTLKVVLGRDPAHGWLNDEIIAACLQQVVEYGLKISNHQAGSTPMYHAFNTFFYKNLREKGTQSVKRWATKAKIGKENLLKVKHVFIPVHHGSHWTLLVISPMARTIEYFDSMGGPADSYVQNVKLWLAEELGKGWKENEWKVPTGSFGAGPKQTNGSDCGVFTCTTARMVLLGVDPMSYGGEDMAVQRSRMVAELLNGGLNGDFEPRVMF
ncbi:hypothetical protein MMC07_009235 [Pseudocyphellaria aurata]|nr:hypothetical protein [Pseudocyphellaria aurata]